MAIAFEAGVTTFDVARSYGYGDAERILGDFLHGKRDRAQIITKGGILPPRRLPLLGAAKSAARALFKVLPAARRVARPALGRQHNAGHFEPSELERSLTSSLRALRSDYVDAFLLHDCSPQTARRADVHETLRGFVRRGMARRVGVASGSQEACVWVEQGGDPTAELSAAELSSLTCSRAEGALWLANQPLGGGEQLTALQRQCERAGLPPTLALKFLLQRPSSLGAHGTVVSMLAPGHVRAAIEAVTTPAVPADLALRLENMLREHAEPSASEPQPHDLRPPQRPAL